MFSNKIVFAKEKIINELELKEKIEKSKIKSVNYKEFLVTK